MILNSDYPLIFYIKNVVKFFKIGQLFSFFFSSTEFASWFDRVE